MGRLKDDLIARADRFADRVADVAGALEKQRRSLRIVDQIYAAGTSVGANYYEADEAMSRKDFCKCLATICKEINECRFWIGFVARRGWVPPKRLEPLLAEANEFRRITGSMLARTRKSDRAKSKARRP